MKKLHILFLVSFFSLISKISAQQDKTIFGEETFTYEKIDIIDIDKGTTIPLTKNKTKQTSNSKSSPSVKSSGSGIGETPGHLSVSFTGAAIYEIPIAVPQGIDGIVPEISLAYNSQGGNGIAGYGWNIKGISTISRIPSSTYYDNRIDGVNFDNSDRFSLDGERLILKSGAYGANGAVYETEKYSNVKITSYGTSPYGSGPSYFIVNYPDGSVARYGSSSDSITHTNYAITYWENPQGIRISYEYTYQYNSQYIDKIKYSSLNSITPINEISFNYHNGERITHGYVHDVSQVRSRILNRIESYSGGILYRKYNLSYDQTQLKYNRLTHLTEYSGDETESHSSIEFTYDDSQSSISHSGLTTSLALNNIEQRNAQVVSLDMTGNGKMDFIVYPNEKDKF